MREETHNFICPYCGKTISMLLDLSVTSQSYVEDCEVCCRPIEIHYSVAGEELTNFTAVRSAD